MTFSHRTKGFQRKQYPCGMKLSLTREGLLLPTRPAPGPARKAKRQATRGNPNTLDRFKSVAAP